MFNEGKHLKELESKGFALVEGVFSSKYITQLRKEVFKGIEKENDYHKSTDYHTFGAITCPPIYGGKFITIFSDVNFLAPFNSILGDECIIYTTTTSCIPPNKTISTCRIHVDSPRVIPSYHTMIAAMVLLDDFTLENGATAFLPFSQEELEKPSDEYFYNNAERLIGKAGDVCYFNTRVWHAGMPNHSKQWRCAFLVAMIRPWMKQRIDIPRAMENAGILEKDIDPIAAQKLGFWAQVPANYDEFFAPPDKRKFKQKIV